MNITNKINGKAIRFVSVFCATLVAALAFGIVNRLTDGSSHTLAAMLASFVSAAFAIEFAERLRRDQSPPTRPFEDLITRAMDLTSTSNPELAIEAGLKLPIQQESAKKLATMGASDPNAQTIRRNRPFDFD